MKIRKLKKNDFKKGFNKCLKMLGDFKLINELKTFKKRKNKKIKTFVIEVNKKIIATASIVIEPKFRHSGKSCGHIEDVCVIKKKQNMGFGKKIIKHLLCYAKKHGCYKLLLSTKKKNLGFYKSLGFCNNELSCCFYI
jgi:glucosamine-phosphate N-acetyltransferase